MFKKTETDKRGQICDILIIKAIQQKIDMWRFSPCDKVFDIRYTTQSLLRQYCTVVERK